MRLKVFLLLTLCASPMMFGWEPTPEPCVQNIITGQVRSLDGQVVPNVPLVLVAYYPDGDRYDLDDQSMTDWCSSDYPSINVRDTTDVNGEFAFSSGYPYDEISDDNRDTLGVAFQLPNDSIVLGLIFAVKDTSSSRTMYKQGYGYSGSGCDCSSSPYTYKGTILYFYNDRDITLP